MQDRAQHLYGETARWCAGAVAIAALCICIIVGNTAVLIALSRTRRAPAHYPLASLAVADLLLGIFVLPIAAIRELFVLHLHWLICVSWETLDVLCCTASILSLCTLGWERWSGITAPLARAKRAKRARILAALVWPVAIAVAVPTAFIYKPKQPHELGDMTCPDNRHITYVFVSSTLSFYLPSVIMLVLYAQILRALSLSPNIRAHRGQSPCLHMSPIGKPAKNATTGCSTPFSAQNIQYQRSPRQKTSKCCIHIPEASKNRNGAEPSSLSTGERQRSLCIITRQRRATRTIVKLMAMFLACWTPFFIMSPVDAVCDCVWDRIWQWCTWLGYTNSALNPLVYAAATPSVRRALHASGTASSRATIESNTTPRRRK